ncbi:unnamed protein product [Didymodactylos carnosus]|uniref:Uncharacterized protein n=1 Tax=Didymodactylos carnosus TaxID=1234261 RepID=A0A813NG94_9BILA|nr:unnamed protein product [Didymodactylos carnosus]CAF0739404.1 unnamed protein product [Didymodactylos carnosus]CAF3492393.1 unnamed protein product [Didymodactylos carnosus]CAF3517572.1 unnamed protein product [Didymodactylos carnosus]
MKSCNKILLYARRLQFMKNFISNTQQAKELLIKSKALKNNKNDALLGSEFVKRIVRVKERHEKLKKILQQEPSTRNNTRPYHRYSARSYIQQPQQSGNFIRQAIIQIIDIKIHDHNIIVNTSTTPKPPRYVASTVPIYPDYKKYLKFNVKMCFIHFYVWHSVWHPHPELGFIIIFKKPILTPTTLYFYGRDSLGVIASIT